MQLKSPIQPSNSDKKNTAKTITSKSRSLELNTPEPHTLASQNIDTNQVIYTCQKCSNGEMLPAQGQGDPEYTDKFVCQNCQFQDTIPTKDLLFNQIFSGLTGICLCVFLLITHLSKLFKGIQHDNMQNALQNSGLVLLSGLFLTGFIYILFRAQEGYKHRKRYTQKKAHAD